MHFRRFKFTTHNYFGLHKMFGGHRMYWSCKCVWFEPLLVQSTRINFFFLFCHSTFFISSSLYAYIWLRLIRHVVSASGWINFIIIYVWIVNVQGSKLLLDNGGLYSVSLSLSRAPIRIAFEWQEGLRIRVAFSLNNDVSLALSASLYDGETGVMQIINWGRQ